MGELKDVMIRLSSNSKGHQTIDVIVVTIPKAYRVILSRDWSAKLNGYFATNLSHLSLPFKGQPNKIKVECERYIKDTVIDLNDPNKPVMFSNSILGNLCFHTFFGELEDKISPFAHSNEQSKLLHTTHISDPYCNIVKYCTKLVTNNCRYLVSSSCNFSLELTDPNIWTLYFDGSKNK